ncbi:Sulfite exporter TauE/SafE [Dissulfuribacter thermophilus]|uniref:Probable membrane transporter protein n=1 Tax=Dissulfuribacter thermophilus TaxID=1156395 RepID=A0A1B9F2X2_9BACT|nr:sulfite exporter TauE/SafE family protein [Dissulfuribacter thermophilus]OCC14223.1 Sulfite exporter TauE/SafE [Dissulfuribacter thermophilus]
MKNEYKFNSKVSIFLASLFVGIIFFASNCFSAPTAYLDAKEYGAGQQVTIKGKIDPGQDLYLVLCTDKLFRPLDAPGDKEREKLTKLFDDTAIPPIYYLITNTPDYFATPKGVPKGQKKGLFAFPPFKYTVRVNKIKKWDEIPSHVKGFLGPINSKEQWDFLRFTHEKKFGINTITKERPVGGGNSRMVLTDYTVQKEAWNKGVSIKLDKETGDFTVVITPYKNIAPGTKMAIWVNGEKSATYIVKPAGFFFKTANTYMNPLVVLLGAFLIGVLFVIMGAAGGLFTAAFQITVLGTKGPIGINAANTVKPTNLFLTLCSPITGLISYFKDRRFAWPVAIFFAIGILIGAFFLGPTFSAKYLPMKAYKFYLGIICLLIGIKLFHESLPSTIEKKKALKAIVQKFNQAVKEAKKTGKAAELGKVEFDKFNIIKFDMRFWGETFVARPLAMLIGGILMGMIAASFGVGGGFMFMPFMTSIMGYPMYLAVPIALAGTFATSVGGITKYILLGYSPDWLMAVCIAAGAIGGGMVGPKIQKRLPEIFLKRLLALALIIVFMKYTQLLWFMR